MIKEEIIKKERIKLSYPSKEFSKKGKSLIKEKESFAIEINGKLYQKLFSLSLPYTLGEKHNTPLWLILLEFIFFLKLDTLIGQILTVNEYNISYNTNKIYLEYRNLSIL